MPVLIGTSGYAYPKWKGSFYPPKTPSKKMLDYYATRFRTVEINNSFYDIPEPTTVAGWTTQVPPDFVFAVKAPQKITHHLRLRRGATDVLAEFLAAIQPLGRRRGPLLFQLPPNMPKDLPLLEAFLAALPKRERVTFEFRHESWFADDVFRALQRARVALCIAESETLSTPLVRTADWGYLRLRREDYGKKDLAAWAQKIVAQPWQRAFVYFKHEDTGTGPRFADQLAQLTKSEICKS
jgi:uncharacterized protein YecE (DUF72 family)